MEVQSDFRDLFVLLNEHKVEHLIIGDYALAFHGAPRFTGDIDIFIRPDPVNAQHIFSALAAFGFSFSNLTLGDIFVNYIGKKQYIANKRAAGRKKDLADIEALGET